MQTRENLILTFEDFLKMAANGGRHFEITLQLKIKFNRIHKSMDTHTHLTDVIFVRYANNHFMGLFDKYYTFIGIVEKKSISAASY